VESGAKNIQLAILRRNKPLELVSQKSVESIVKAIADAKEKEKEKEKESGSTGTSS